MRKDNYTGNILNSPKYKRKQSSEYINYQANVENATNASSIVKFNGHQGHGFAAERANNLIDNIPEPEIIYSKNYTIYGAGKLYTY